MLHEGIWGVFLVSTMGCKGLMSNMWLASSQITQKGGVLLALTTRFFSPFKMRLLQKTGRSFNFLKICPFQRRKLLPLSTVWFCVISFSTLNMVWLCPNMHPPFPAPASSECMGVSVSSGLLSKKSHVVEMLPLASRQRKVSSQVSQDHLRWRSVLGKGSAIQIIIYSSSNVQGREPGQLQIETPATA